MDNKIKTNQCVYYCKPKYGISPQGAESQWHYMIYELREGIFIEYAHDFMDYAVIMPKGRVETIKIPHQLFTGGSKKEALAMLEFQNEGTIKNLFNLLAEHTSKISKLEEKFKKLKDI